MVKPRQAANNSWLFDKIFGDDDFIAAGQLIIPPKGRKPSKAAKDNTYVSCYLIITAIANSLGSGILCDRRCRELQNS